MLTIEAGLNRIIMIGSVNGDRMPLPGMASYALSKSALQGMARALARDFGPRGITINIVQPGPIQTSSSTMTGLLLSEMSSHNLWRAVTEDWTAEALGKELDAQDERRTGGEA